jgi:hypothetical protein
LLKSIQVKAQKSIQAKTIDKNLKVHSTKTNQLITVHSNIKAKITKNKATEVPSLKRLSHSNKIVSLLGAQSDLKIERTATGSVDEISIQNNKQTKKGISNQTKGNK